jgi:hypothetical protein
MKVFPLLFELVSLKQLSCLSIPFVPFSVSCFDARQSERKRNPLFRVSNEAVGIAFGETRGEEVRMHFLCIVPSPMKLPTFLRTTALQLLQIELLVRGWKRIIGSHEVA